MYCEISYFVAIAFSGFRLTTCTLFKTYIG